jgi:hypothetical protein
MEMKMSIDGRELDSIKVHLAAQSDERYVAWLKQELRRKHCQLLSELGAEPLFYLVTSTAPTMTLSKSATVKVK